jgi:teichuronic acid biosynthesis glycosyltransferase TuaC
MRVLAITSCYPHPENPRHCVYHEHKMRALARVHELRLIVPVSWRERVRALAKPANKQTLRISYPTYWYSPKILEQLYGHFYLASIKKTVRQAVADFRPDVVFACWAHPDGWAALQIGRELGVPVVIKVIGSDVLLLSRRPRRRRILAQTLCSADGVIATSRSWALVLKTFTSFPKASTPKSSAPVIDWRQEPPWAFRVMRRWCCLSGISCCPRARAC